MGFFPFGSYLDWLQLQPWEKVVCVDLSTSARRSLEGHQNLQNYRSHCRARSTAPWSTIPMDLLTRHEHSDRVGKKQTNVCPNTRNQGPAQDYSMAKTSSPESCVLKTIQNRLSLAWILRSSEEMLTAGTSQHLARPREGTLVFPLCKSWLPISKPCSLLNLLILHYVRPVYFAAKHYWVYPAPRYNWLHAGLTPGQAES